MKKILCLALAGLLLLGLCGAALAVPKLSETLFDYAKATLTCLAAGSYDKIVTNLPFSDVSPSADEWARFANGNFSALNGTEPQTRYAVAYWTGRVWKVAVPVSEPDNSGVETLVLSSEDGSSFNGYGCMSWGDVEKEYQSSDYVNWNREYADSTSAVVEADVDRD